MIDIKTCSLHVLFDQQVLLNIAASLLVQLNWFSFITNCNLFPPLERHFTTSELKFSSSAPPLLTTRAQSARQGNYQTDDGICTVDAFQILIHTLKTCFNVMALVPFLEAFRRVFVWLPFLLIIIETALELFKLKLLRRKLRPRSHEYQNV